MLGAQGAEVIDPPACFLNALRHERVKLAPDLSNDLRKRPALEMDDINLKTELEELLTSLSLGNPYSDDGSFARNTALLPPGLRAMAATHWLDISLTLDSITWHFGNFGEAGLVAETEAGLRELGLHELAECFVEARDLMVPLLAQRTDADEDPFQILERAGRRDRGDEIDRRAWALDDPEPVICKAWIRYTRQYPERVFG